VQRSRIPGVSLIAPPNSIKFETRPKEPPTNQPSPPSSVHGANPDALANYLVFISIDANKRKGILNILLQNDIDHYQMFSDLSVSELSDLGFSVGVISKLRTNVGKYKNHLATAE
jgi:hypothetical protein